jgi:hypothetical protein
MDTNTDNAAGTRCIAFEGSRRIASGELEAVASKAKQVLDRGERGPVLIFDDLSSEPIEIDFRGTQADVLRRLARRSRVPQADHEPTLADESAPRGPGRPRLGVVAREVTLLPRHWAWLGEQPGGASVALRKLVEEARRNNESRDRVRRALEAAYRFMSAMAGNRPRFEEATRALFALDRARFSSLIETWPADVRKHLTRLADVAFDASAQPRAG